MAEWTEASTQLKNQHPYAPYVDPVVVLVRLLNHFRGKIVQSPAVCFPFGLLVLDEVGPAEVGQFEHPVLVYEYVLWLDVAMYDVVLVDVLQGLHDLLHIFCCHTLWETLGLRITHDLVELTSFCELEDKQD